jgi:hypothetical protein
MMSLGSNMDIQLSCTSLSPISQAPLFFLLQNLGTLPLGILPYSPQGIDT